MGKRRIARLLDRPLPGRQRGFLGMPLLGGGGQGYQIRQSLRFDKANSANFTQTPGADYSSKHAGFSVWFRFSDLPSSAAINFITAGTSSANGVWLYWSTTGSLMIQSNTASTNRGTIKTDALVRDVTAWYHALFLFDLDNVTVADRMQIWLNGVRQTISTSTSPVDHTPVLGSNSYSHSLGYWSGGYMDGYMAMPTLVLGRVPTVDEFGQFDSTTGVWVPINASGVSVGTGGSQLDFADATSATTLGYDVSGNANHWTPSAGVATGDQVADSPTNTYPIWSAVGSLNSPTLTNGALQAATPTTPSAAVRSTCATPESGKWYFEVTAMSAASTFIGLQGSTAQWSVDAYNSAPSVFYRASDGHKWVDASGSTYGATYTTGDIIGIALDVDAGTVEFFKNNTSQGTITGLLTGLNWFVCVDDASSGTTTVSGEFGQIGFAYTPPTGYKALCTANLDKPTIIDGSQYMNSVLYTGDGVAIGSGGQAITGVNFQPDLVWVKNRVVAHSHYLWDAVRGAQKRVYSDSSAVEGTETEGLDTFDTDGFTVGSLAGVNGSGNTLAAWCWKEGATPGFDIVGYAGTGVNRTVAHSLGVVPDMMIVKDRTGASNWVVYHQDVGATKFLNLNNSAAATTASTVWNDTAPTASVFSVGTADAVNNAARNYIAYLFAAVEGFSAFGAYTGNGNVDGPFVWCGFRPAFVLVKRVDSTSSWDLRDYKRTPNNVSDTLLWSDGPWAEAAHSDYYMDLLSGGFKIRTNTSRNASGGTYIYAAFAENPFKYARAA